MLSSNISSTCPHYMVNFSLLAAEIGPVVSGIPANFNGFASWQRYCSDVAQRKPTKLHSVWPSPGLVHYIYIFGDACAVTEFCLVQNSLCFLQVLRCRILVGSSVTARHLSSGRDPNFVALSTGRHLYLAGRPSHWALAHILASDCDSEDLFRLIKPTMVVWFCHFAIIRLHNRG